MDVCGGGGCSAPAALCEVQRLMSVCPDACLIASQDSWDGTRVSWLSFFFSFFFLNPDPGDCSVLDPDPDGTFSSPPSVSLEM